MKFVAQQIPPTMPVDDEHARMMAYARSREGRAHIEKAQAEIDAGLGIVADNAYFENLKKRRARRRAVPPSDHA
jgi:hypothetical protein